MIDDAIAQLLAARSGVTDVAPTTTVKRHSDLPRLMYTAIDAPLDYTDDGPAGIIPARYQVDSYDTTATAARLALTKLMRSAHAADAADRGLEGYAGTIADTDIVRISFTGQPRFGPVALVSQGSNQTTPRLILEMQVFYRP